MIRAIQMGACGFLALWLCACATTRYEEFGPPPGTGSALSPVELKADSTLLRAEIEARIARLEEGLEDRLVALEMANASMVTQLMSLSEQLEGLQRQIQGLQGADQVPEEGRMGGSPAPDLNELYGRALQQYSACKYEEAREGFMKVLELSPGGELADNAQYWLGECAYALKDYERAVVAFQKIFEFEHTEKDDDAQLKLGLCYLQLGQPERALIELKRLIVDYPRSEYLGRADELIRKIRQSHPVAP